MQDPASSRTRGRTPSLFIDKTTDPTGNCVSPRRPLVPHVLFPDLRPVFGRVDDLCLGVVGGRTLWTASHAPTRGEVDRRWDLDVRHVEVGVHTWALDDRVS